MTMTSRQRIMAALALNEPDQVPFADYVDEGIRKKLMGKEEFNEAEFAKKLGMDAIYFLDYVAPLFCSGSATPGASNEGIEFMGEGLIKKEKDLDLMVFPNPHNECFYDSAKRFVDRYGKEDLAIYAGLRPFGMFNTIFTMGIEAFSYALYDNRKLIEEVMDRYIEWNCVVVEKLQQVGIDFIMAYNDMAFRSGPIVSPQIFREVFLPKMKIVADKIKIPWVFHSDGNLAPVFDDLLTLGMNGINPFEPPIMDIKKYKEEYGRRICLWGNIDLVYTLTRGTTEEVEAEVKQRIREVGPNGGFILASANSITDYCKVENVWAMINAVRKYGKYPLKV